MKNRVLRPLGRRGVALPIALFGLVAITLLVTTALLTSSSEFAISSAHRTAAGSLYGVDGALEQYVGTRLVSGAPELFVPGTHAVTTPEGRYNVTVNRMARTINGAGTEMYEVMSLVAEPANGRGRAVGAFINAIRGSTPLSTNINAGATSGGDLRVSGNATVSDGRSGTNYCNAQNNQSEYAVQVSAGSKITEQGSSTVEGATNVATWKKEDMEKIILGDLTLRELADKAEIKFGPRWNQPAWTTTIVNSERGTGYNPRFDWGCPEVLGASCPTDPAVRAAAIDRHVAVAIDAQGGTVSLNGRYGQGIIVVVNGNLTIQGNFIFKGIILVEKDMDIRGGAAGQESKIEGAVIAFGAQSTVEDNITGTATIKFNLCSIRDAERALNSAGLLTAPQRRDGRTYSWYEIVR